MHIGIDISRIATQARTGTEQYSYELLAALSRIDRRNAYTLYCNHLPVDLPPLSPNFRLRAIPFPRLWTHIRLSAELLTGPPEVLFVPAHVIPLAAPLARSRLVVTVHDLGYLHFPEAHTRAQRLQLRLTTAWSARVADQVIAISQATRNDLIRLARIPPGKVAVVYHGVSPRFQPLASQPGPRPYLLYVGTIQPRKNLIRVIEAFAQIASAIPAYDLQIVGRRGWLSEPIERRIVELGMQTRIRLPGYVADEELPAFLAGASAFVLPSLYEGFGMPVLEAMASGVPVLCSTTSALPEVAGDAALLVYPLDTNAIATGMLRLATDATLRELLRERGLARAAGFTWERCARETLAVLY